jgi:hypothetical protein
VTDSFFHHYLDINLIGDPCGASPDRQQGFGGLRAARGRERHGGPASSSAGNARPTSTPASAHSTA